MCEPTACLSGIHFLTGAAIHIVATLKALLLDRPDGQRSLQQPTAPLALIITHATRASLLPYGARFGTDVFARGCDWFPRLLA
jgi:hypothetical protein